MTDTIKISRELLEHLVDSAEFGSGIDTPELIAARALLSTPPADAADMGGQAGEEVEVVQYQCREIGETDWEECGIEGFNYCNRSPLHDTRTLMTVAQHQRITAAMAAEVERLRAMLDDWEADANLLEKERDALRAALIKTVASLDQLLPHAGKIPADVGLLNDALVAARPLLELNTNKEVTPDGK